MDHLTLIQRIAIWTLPILFAITVHEVAHGWMARRLGDPTAMMLGRLTLNPIKHIDPIGTILVPGLLLLFGGFIFGWAKPVPVTWENLKHPKRDMAMVAAAGPLANLVMAFLWAIVAKLGFMLGNSFAWAALPMIYMGGAGIAINVVLMVLNLLPIPPLDGGRVLGGLLPGPWAWQLSRLEPYGFLILLVLLMTGLLGNLLHLPVTLLQELMFNLVGL
ncbi:MAG: site-2 protease family protein [Gammaproteobacteria bacterium]